MRIEVSAVQKLVFRDIPSLDPVTVVIDDMGVGRGSITLTCYGKAWTMYAGAMGDQRIGEFFCSAHDDYLAGKLSSIEKRVTDYDAISRDIGEEVDVTTLLFHDRKVAQTYGPHWHHDLPQKDNPDYVYLRRIIRAVQDGLKEYQALPHTDPQ